MAKKGRAEIMDINPIAYTIKDVCFGSFDVLNSANAWWLDKIKVVNLINHFKIDGTQEEACSVAGITKAQFDYFVEKHPIFSDIMGACRELPNIKARTTVNNNLNKVDCAFKYLEKKRKKEFGNALDLTSGGEAIRIKWE